MATVLDELSAGERDLDRTDIENRVSDWRARIGLLYERIESWLPPGLTTDRSGTVQMDEELMRKFDVPAISLPVLNISRKNQWLGKLIPRGLWIIGANGRLDLYFGKKHYIVVDKAENFSRAEWQIAPAEARRDTRPLSRESLLALLPP